MRGSSVPRASWSLRVAPSQDALVQPILPFLWPRSSTSRGHSSSGNRGQTGTTAGLRRRSSTRISPTRELHVRTGISPHPAFAPSRALETENSPSSCTWNGGSTSSGFSTRRRSGIVASSPRGCTGISDAAGCATTGQTTAKAVTRHVQNAHSFHGHQRTAVCHTPQAPYLPNIRPSAISASPVVEGRNASILQNRHASTAATPPQHARHASTTPTSIQAVGSIPWASLAKPLETEKDFQLAGSPLLLDVSPLPVHGHFASMGGTGTDLNQMHQTLHACLRVGRLDRARAILRRLNQIYKADAPGLLAAHQDYLREITFRVVQHRDVSLLNDLVRWFEVEMRHHGVPLDAATFALIIQAAMQHDNPRKSARMVRRYYSLAKEAGVETETKELVPQLEESLAQQDAFSMLEPSSSHPDPPDLQSLKLKGLGLVTLKKALASMQHRQDVPSDVARQQILERNTLAAATERWRNEAEQLRKLGISSGTNRPSIGSLMWTWHEQLMPAIQAELSRADGVEGKARPSVVESELLQVAPYLQALPVQILSAVTILSCLRGIPTASKDGRGTTLATLIYTIGQWVEAECEQTLAASGSRWRKLSRFRGAKSDSQHYKDPTLNEEGEDQTLSPAQMTPWPSNVRVQVGSVLFSLLAESASIEVSSDDVQQSEVQPAFFHTHQFIRGKKIGMVMLNNALMEKLNQEPVAASLARHLPMLTPPKPWTNFRTGGFLEQRMPAVRHQTREPCALQYAKVACSNGDMKDVFAGLDSLGRTAWTINRPVFDAMTTSWNRGHAIADIPAESPDIPLPPEPAESEGADARRKWLRQSRIVQNELAGLRSQRSFINFQLETARAFVDEVFYFPHNVDFRGRAYPMTPFLNHMGADNARGLLKFGRGKELGAAGLWWLKVHLANVYGYDKASFSERQIFAEQHMAEIVDSAERPLDGQRWWLSAENPWQCLATCVELASATRLADPTKFVSHLPVHQDGTCNGLQHYAALGGDIVGAKQVNLEPGDRPADIYTAVAEAVKEEVVADAKEGHALAKTLEGKLTRKVVKQTVMTNVYGVTYVGARRQVRGQLEDVLVDYPDTAEINLGTAASYIVGKIFRTLSNMFNGAHDIQYWLGDCGSRICDSLAPNQVRMLMQDDAPGPSDEKQQSEFKVNVLTGGNVDKDNVLGSFITPIIWTTPLKMPVVQPYRKESHEVVVTRSQSVRLLRSTHSSVVDKARQLQAFPPNFIHSLDGTHMFLTALRCNEAGLAFAAVHDSFWTHAADVDEMARYTREAFIRMHSEDIMGRLAAEFKVRYRGYMHKVPIASNSPAGLAIKQWRRSSARGSKKKHRRSRFLREVVVEQQRLDLLASDHPEDRAKGEAMVTAGSIVAAHKDVMDPELHPTILGNMDLRNAKLKSNEQLTIGDEANVDEVFPSEPVNHTEPPAETDDVPPSSNKPRRRLGSPRTWAWVPLEFSPVPKKGAFDIAKLKDSLYFFS